jgi:RecB family exonuclease
MRYSFTRIDTYEVCPRHYRLIYIDKIARERTEPLLLGDVLHVCLERLVGPTVGMGQVPRPDPSFVAGVFTTVATAKGLVGLRAFEDGLEALHAFFAKRDEAAPVIAVEKQFEVDIGGIVLIGKMDRVDDRGEGRIEVVDYKTGQVFYSRAEVEASLQLAIYDIAARELWPEAHTVLTTLHSIRTDQKFTMEHPNDHIEQVKLYIRSLVDQIENDREWKPRLNDGCIYCEGRVQCDAYQGALRGERNVPMAESLDDLEAVAREREEVALLVRTLDKRKKELEGAIRPHLESVDQMVLGGCRYKLVKNTSVEYPAEDVIMDVGKATDIDPAFLAGLVCKVDSKALQAYLAEYEEMMGVGALTRLRARLENVANRGGKRAKFDARKLPKERKGKKS